MIINYFETVLSLANLDLSLAALLGWIRWTLAALSKALKVALKFFGFGFLRLDLINFFKASSRFLFRAVRILSFRIFLIADLMSGMGGMLT